MLDRCTSSRVRQHGYSARSVFGPDEGEPDVLTLLAVSAVVAGGVPPALPPGCDHLHGYRATIRGVRANLRHHRPTVDRRRLQHFARCTRTKRAARRAIHSGWRWRHSYAHRWRIAFNRLPAGDRAWAWSTGACESGNNPATNTGNGFHGAFQFVLSTWHAAGGSGIPEQHSWHYQAVIAVRWMHIAGRGQWPVCG